MIIDAHYHLDERVETVAELLRQMGQHGIDRVALIPAMCDPVRVEGLAAQAGPIIPKALLGHWRSLGLLLYKTTVTSKGEFSSLGKTYPIYDTPDNGSVARAMEAHPDKFYGWIFVNPKAAEPLAELEKWAPQPGWIGVKAHPFGHRYALRLLDEVAAYCVEKDWPLLIHLGGDAERGDYRCLPERHPKLMIVYAHAGLPFFREVWEYAKEKRNIFVDLSNPLFVDEKVRLGAVRALGAEKCLHGTDGPFANANQGKMLQDVLRLPVSEREKKRILGDNFTELVGR